MTPNATAVLCECDPSFRPDHRYLWCGRERDDVYRITNQATRAETLAAEALVKGDVRRLVFALHGLDNDAGRTISEYSHLAAHRIDREDIAVACQAHNHGCGCPSVKDHAERRHARREAEALEELVKPAPRWANLRRRIIQALRAAGVDFWSRTGYANAQDPDNPCVFVARDIVRLYNTLWSDGAKATPLIVRAGDHSRRPRTGCWTVARTSRPSNFGVTFPRGCDGQLYA